MKIRRLHDFDLEPREAILLQRRLAGRIRAQGRAPRPLRRVVGVDCSIASDGRLCAAAVACRAPDWAVDQVEIAAGPAPMPYVPGLLSFREAPLVLEALRRIRGPVQVVLVDGQGRAHPRRLGLASHLGLFLDPPTIGVAKSLFVGTHEEPGPVVGDRAPLLHEGERVGVVLRTRVGVKPVYVSVGQGIGLLPAVRTVLRTLTSFRLPEPIRAADRLSRRAARFSG